MSNNLRGCLLEYVVFLLETGILIAVFLLKNLWWIILAILIGAGIEFAIYIIQTDF